MKIAWILRGEVDAIPGAAGERARRELRALLAVARESKSSHDDDCGCAGTGCGLKRALVRLDRVSGGGR